MDFKQAYTTFDGRINRKPYWLGMVLLIGIMIIVWLILGAILIGVLGTGSSSEAIIQLIFTAIIAYPATALMVKRLHDRNKPGIFAAIFWTPSILQILGQIAGITGTMTDLNGAQVYLPNTLGWIILAAGLIIGLWALIELGFLRGTDGPNEYGPDPLQQ